MTPASETAQRWASGPAANSLATTTLGDGPIRYVFLHGLFGRGKNWTAIAKRLLPQTSLLVDLANHGASPWTPRFSYTDMADDVVNLLEALPSPPCLVGHSMGGKTAMMTALARPDLVGALVIEDIAPQDSPVDEMRHYAHAMESVSIERASTRHEVRVMLDADIPDPSMVGFLLQNLRLDPKGSLMWTINLDVLSRDMDIVGGWPDVEGTYRGPTLWITGGTSQITRDVPTPSLRRLFPHLVHTVFPDAGHWVHADEPEGFARAVQEFSERMLTA